MSDAVRSGHRLTLRGFLLVLALSVLAGCGSTGRVLPVALDQATPPTDWRVMRTHEEAVKGLAAIIRADLGLPLPRHIVVDVYPTREAFEQGLIHDGNVSPGRAAELAEFAIGVGKRRQLLLNDEGSARGREWLRLIAHELTHVGQIELAHGEGRGEQWLAEGMAEWVAFNVLERLGLDTVARRRIAAVAGIRNHAALVSARLDLETLGTPRGFTVRHLKEGSLPTYQLAFLMSDYLIAREGFAGVTRYFGLYAHGTGREAAFEQAFGQTLEQFEQEVLAYLKTVVKSR